MKSNQLSGYHFVNIQNVHMLVTIHFELVEAGGRNAHAVAIYVLASQACGLYCGRLTCEWFHCVNSFISSLS